MADHFSMLHKDKSDDGGDHCLDVQGAWKWEKTGGSQGEALIWNSEYCTTLEQDGLISKEEVLSYKVSVALVSINHKKRREQIGW